MPKQTKIDIVDDLNFSHVDKIADSNRVYGVLDTILNKGEEYARENYGDDVVDRELIRMNNRRI